MMNPTTVTVSATRTGAGTTTSTSTSTSTSTAMSMMGQVVVDEGHDHEKFLAPFQADDFDPVAYAANLTEGHNDINHHDHDHDDSLALVEARLAFAAQDVSRQIDALVASHHQKLRATVHALDTHHAHVHSHLTPRLDSLASLCTQWRKSVADPARALRSTLATARTSRDLHALASLLAHLTSRAASLPNLPTHIADPESVPDTRIPTLATTLADLASSLTLVDLSGIDLVDTILAPHIAGCRAALLARCNAMVHPKDLARTKLALQGLATLGVLADWHALRVAKVVGKLESTLKEWLDALCAAEQPAPTTKLRKQSNPVSPQAVFSQFDTKVVAFLSAEARFFHTLLASYPFKDASKDPWSDFWSSVAATLDRHLGGTSSSPTLSLGYPTLHASLARLANQMPAAPSFDFATTSLASLHPHYVSRITSHIHTSLTSLFQPARASSAASAQLPAVPSNATLSTLVTSWTSHLTGCADTAVHAAVASGLAQLTSALLSLCSDTLPLMALFSDAGPTPAQLHVMHVARGLVYIGTAVDPTAASGPVAVQLARTLADATALVDIALQSIVAAVHAAVLDAAPAPAGAGAGGGGGGDWPVRVSARLTTAHQLLAPLDHTADLVGPWRHVLACTLLQHVPVCIALGVPRPTDHAGRVRVVDALAAVEPLVASVGGGGGGGGRAAHVLPTFGHLQALRIGVLAGDEVGGGGGAWARAARASPVVTGVYYLRTAAGAVVDWAKCMGRCGDDSAHGEREVLAWVLAWVERWDAAAAGVQDAGAEDKAIVWQAWAAVMDRVLGDGGWRAVVGEWNETTDAFQVEDES